jgi:hypothetical protein
MKEMLNKVLFEVTEKVINSDKTIFDKPFFGRIVHSMNVNAVLLINEIYDKDKTEGRETLSIFFIIDWIRTNIETLISTISSLTVTDIDKGLKHIEQMIYEQDKLLNRLRRVRNKLLAHSDKTWSNKIDESRLVVNAPKEEIKERLNEWMTNVKTIAVPAHEMKELGSFTVGVLLGLKNTLNMPDRIFGKSGNIEEWNKFYNLQTAEAKDFFTRIAK